MNEVESGTRRAVEETQSRLSSAWYGVTGWFSGLGQGVWLLGIGAFFVVAIVTAVLMGRGGTSVCDQAVNPTHDIRLHNGNQSLQFDSAETLHADAKILDGLAAQSTGDKKQAFQALASVAHGARTDHAFQASSELSEYQSACG